MIQTIITKVTYTGNGKNKAFPFSFPFNKTADMHVAIYDKDTEKSTELTKDFYVDANAKVVYYPGYAPGQAPAAAEQPAILPASKTITIYRETDIDQLTDLGDKFPLPQIEAMSDKLTMILQEHNEELARAVKVEIGDPETPEQRYLEMQTYVSETKANASAAANSASAAEKSAMSAGASATQAAQSKNDAAISEKNAVNAASAAANSANFAAAKAANAAASAGTANANMIAAGNSERNAANSANKAAQMAAIASTAANSATSSENNARAYSTSAQAAAKSADFSNKSSKAYADNALLAQNIASQHAGAASISATAAKQAANDAAKNAAESKLAKLWAVCIDSPDNEKDAASPTGLTQSSRSWAMVARSKATLAANSAKAVQDVVDNAIKVLQQTMNAYAKVILHIDNVEEKSPIISRFVCDDGTIYTIDNAYIGGTPPQGIGTWFNTLDIAHDVILVSNNENEAVAYRVADDGTQHKVIFLENN